MNQQHDRIVALCEQLKLDGSAAMAGSGAGRCQQGSQLRRLPRSGAMPSIKTLEQFDWNHAGGAPKAQIQELAHLTFVQRAENVVLLGPSGVGKTRR